VASDWWPELKAEHEIRSKHGTVTTGY